MTVSITMLCHYDECRVFFTNYSEEYHFAQCHYAECRYAECRYAECLGADKTVKYQEVTIIKAHHQELICGTRQQPEIIDQRRQE